MYRIKSGGNLGFLGFIRFTIIGLMTVLYTWKVPVVFTFPIDFSRSWCYDCPTDSTRGTHVAGRMWFDQCLLLSI